MQVLAGIKILEGIFSDSGILYIILKLDLTNKSACKKNIQATNYLQANGPSPLNRSVKAFVLPYIIDLL